MNRSSLYNLSAVAQIKQAKAFYEKGGNSDVIFPKG